MVVLEQVILDTSTPVKQYEKCSCGFEIQYYMIGGKTQERKEIVCPICGRKTIVYC